MRWAAKAGQGKLEWSILDVEQEEWERRLAELGVAAAANGFPVQPPAAAAATDGERAAVTHTVRSIRRLLPALTLVAVLLGVAAALAGYSVYRTAQSGVAHMEGDIANAVKLESLREHNSKGMQAAPVLAEVPGQISVHAVEFLGNAAMATVLVTQTQRPGEVVVMPELRFYVQTAIGWQPSAPIAGFWGPTETLDTAHLHFVFGRRDRAVVAAAAPDTEATYVLLHRATGVDLAPGDLVPIEIVPESFPHAEQLGDGRLRLTSPSLYKIPVQARAALLDRLLRSVLVKQLMAAAGPREPAKAQWQPLVQALGFWLESSTAIGFAPNDEAAALRRLVLRLPHSSWHLADLQENMLRYDPASQRMVVFTLVSDGEWQRQRSAAAEQLIDYIAATYGIDALPKLLQGFAQYDDWEELAPAVLGVSAAELEEGWHTAMREGAPLRTIH